MKSKSCGWRTPGKCLGRRTYGTIRLLGKARMNDEGPGNGVSSYMDYVANAASFEAFCRQDADPLLSAETLPESSSLIDFKAFAHEYPDHLFPLVMRLRPEFQEFFMEYYLLEKSQSFIGKTHGQIQTRVWQNLRIIEQTIGSLILLGTNPDESVLRPILEKAKLETTPYGSLTQMILLYAASQDYTSVAKQVSAPAAAIRKIFRPAITALLADKNVKTVAVGAYLRSLTHQASLTGAGLSKRCIARTRRVKTLHFTAPPSDDAALISFGSVVSLRDIPWCMLEISSEHRMTQILPTLRNQGKKIFGKRAAQIFAPINADGELEFGYIFARSAVATLVRGLTRIRGISELVSVCNDEGVFVRTVTIPNADVQGMISQHSPLPISKVRVSDFVEIMTGPASKYCGTITETNGDEVTVEVNFPTGRHFLVLADKTCVKLLPAIPKDLRKFWGTRFH